MQKAISSAQPKLNKTDVKTVYIAIPPIKEQKKITEYLDYKCKELDSSMADIQTQVDVLEQYKRSVIIEAVTKGLNPDAGMKDSGTPWIGAMPQNWDIIRGKYLLKYVQKLHASAMERLPFAVIVEKMDSQWPIKRLDTKVSMWVI